MTIINAILRGLGKYELSSDEFKDLKNIKPVSFNLPLDNCVAKQRSSEAAKQRSSEAAKQRSSEAAKQRSSEAAKQRSSEALTLLSKLIGGTGQIFNSKPGAYVLTNKINGNTYVGSAISLANRLFNSYFHIAAKDNRVIIKAIKEIGLENFTLDVYLIPKEMIELTLLSYKEEVGTSLDPARKGGSTPIRGGSS